MYASLVRLHTYIASRVHMQGGALGVFAQGLKEMLEAYPSNPQEGGGVEEEDEAGGGSD